VKLQENELRARRGIKFPSKNINGFNPFKMDHTRRLKAPEKIGINPARKKTNSQAQV
jgi:hypothetical protein